MPNIRAVLFDKDGTLLDFNATWLEFGREIALEAAGGSRKRSAELLEAAGYDAETENFRAGSAFAAGTTADVMTAFYPAATESDLRHLIADVNRRAALMARERATPLPGIIKAVGELHGAGYRLGMATNDATSGAEETLLAFGIAHFFDAAYGYDAVANPKPAPDVIFAFADTVGIKPSEVAMVGDNAHDLETARAAGAGLAIGVLTGNSTHGDLAGLADTVLRSVTDLPAFLADRTSD